MNILYIAHQTRKGGATLSLLDMIDEFRANNQIYVSIPIRKGFLADELKKRQIPIYHRHSFWWMLAPASTPRRTLLKKIIYRFLCINNYLCALSLISVVKKNRIEIIHTNSSTLNLGGILASMTGLPHVWHLREFGKEDFDFFSVYKEERLNDFINTHSDKVIAISKAVAVKFCNKISAKKLVIIYNGVSEKNKVLKTEIREEKGRIECLIAGNICIAKGQEEAIQAVASLVREGYKNLHLSIAGAGNTKNLEQLIKKENMQEFISILGSIGDMPALRKKMDIELVCSVCEAFGRVTVEAMMSSNPVIGSNTGGTPELIQNGINGYLYQKGNVQDLADKIRLFLDDPQEVRRLGRNAFYSVENKFTRRKNAENVMKIYRELKDSPRSI